MKFKGPGEWFAQAKAPKKQAKRSARTPLAKRAGKLSQKSVNYRMSAGPSSEHCGSCSMFQPIAGKTGTCALVAGVIEADHVCDRWAPRALKLNPEE